MFFNFSNLVVDTGSPSHHDPVPPSSDVWPHPVPVEVHLPTSHSWKRPSTRGQHKPSGIALSSPSMVGSRSPGSFCDNSEGCSPVSGTSSRFFDGLHSSVTKDEFPDLVDSLQLPNSISVRLLEGYERPSRPPSDEVALNICSFEFGLTLSLPQFFRRLFSVIDITLIQAHPHFYKFVMACHNIRQIQ